MDDQAEGVRHLAGSHFRPALLLPAAAQDKAVSPIEDGKTFLGNGFDRETLAPPVRVLEPEDGWVAVSAESARETRVLVSAYGAEAWQKDLALVNQVDGEGRTALMLAARKGHREIAELLLARQAAPHLRSDEGRTALDYARGSGNAGLAALLERLPPVSTVYAEEDLLGEWEGVITVGDVLHGLGGGADPYSCRLTISHRGSALGARATLLRNLGAEEGRKLFAGTVPRIVPLPHVDQGACVQELDLQVSGKEIFLLGRRQQVLFRSGDTVPVAPLFCLRGTMSDPGLIHGYSDVNGENLFYLEKAGPAARPPVPFERGKTTTVACAYFPQISYSCYVPESWDPSKPVSALLFSLPEEAKAVPLSPAAAEELGWISVGTQRGSFDTLHVLIDLKRRFRVANGRIHLAGFSHSARVNNSWAGCLGPFLGGVISIGGYYPRERFAPDYGVPVFFITGDRDECSARPSGRTGPAAPDLRRPGGDAFLPGSARLGAPDLHAEAMRWLSRFQ